MLKHILISAFLTLIPLASAHAVFGGIEVKETDRIIENTVGIYNKVYDTTCSGVLLADNLIVTAAHCLTPDHSNIRIFFGANVSGAPVRRVVDGIRHPDYRDDARGAHQHDIAVIKFRGSIPEGFKPAKFLENMDVLENMSPTAIAGYGTVDALRDRGLRVLRKTVLPIRDIRYSPSEISLIQSPDTGACAGDSGGPSYVYVGEQPYIWGIAQKVYSYGSNECMFGSAYTRIDYYRDWIEKTARTLRGTAP